jgi:PAS domain S-box-containing protein
VSQAQLPSTPDGSPVVNSGQVFGAGEMADRIRHLSWAETPLGPLSCWSDSLCAAINTVLRAPVPMQLFWGPELIVLYNDALIPIMTTKHPAALGQPAHECWSEAWSIVGPQMATVMAGGGAVSFTHVVVPIVRNGKLEDVYWNYSYSPWVGADGRIEGVLDIAFDVTKAVLSQRALQVSERRANRILQSIGDAVIVTDAASKVDRMNPVAEQLTGWSEQEAQNVPLSQVFRIVNETTRNEIEVPSDKAMRTGKVVGLANHTVLIAKDGTETNIDDSGAPIRDEDGHITGGVLVFRNINERRRAEKARNALTRRLNQVMQATTDAIVTVDRNWVMTYINPQAEKIYLAGGEILGRTVWERFPSAVYEGSPYVEHYNRAMEDGVPGEFEAYYPDPLNIWLKIEVYPSEDGIVTFSRDITLQKQRDSALIETEKLAAVGRLAASIAHEINNPLEAVTNLLYIAKSTDTLDGVREHLDVAEAELQRVAVIANQTLRFHKQSSSPRAVTFDELVGTVLAVFHGRLASAQIRLERRDRTTEPLCCYDGEIRQLLANLLGNAIDASSPGGRILLRSRRATHPKTGYAGLLITVADEGSGISAAALAKIFDAFFTTKGAAGNGLGLWVSKQIVDNHGGSLRVRSSQNPGRSGTVFTLFLPLEAVSR